MRMDDLSLKNQLMSITRCCFHQNDKLQSQSKCIKYSYMKSDVRPSLMATLRAMMIVWCPYDIY